RTGHRAGLSGAGQLPGAPLPAGDPHRRVGAPPLRRTRPRPAHRNSMTRHGVLKRGTTHAFERKRIVAQCITCGSELHPERAKKYDYCMAPECQEKNLKGVTLVAVGVNKSAEQYMLLDDETRDELARGKYHDQRRASFGTSVASSPGSAVPAQPRRPEPRQAPSRPTKARPTQAEPTQARPTQSRPA